MSPEDSTDLPRPRVPYERHRQEPFSPQNLEAGTPSLDPLKWKPIRLGLTLVLAGWLMIMAMMGVFTFCHFFTFFKSLFDEETFQILAKIIGAGALLGGLLAFAGKCLCTVVPKVARARRFVIASIVFTVATVGAAGVFYFAADSQPSPLPENPRPPSDKAEGPPAQAETTNPKVDQKLPGFAIPKQAKLIVLASYLVSQVLFIFFLKRVAAYHNDIFLAESMGGYLTLLVTHTALVALLPPQVMIACFFWVIMLAIEFLLMGWMLRLVASTRRAIG